MDYLQLRSKFYKLLDLLSEQVQFLKQDEKKRIIEFTINDAKELIECGEEFVAFENLCENLYEVAFPLSRKIYQEIELIGQELTSNESAWKFLKEIVQE